MFGNNLRSRQEKIKKIELKNICLLIQFRFVLTRHVSYGKERNNEHGVEIAHAATRCVANYNR